MSDSDHGDDQRILVKPDQVLVGPGGFIPPPEPASGSYFQSPSLFWWILIPAALLVNLLALVAPSLLNTWLLPVVGPFAYRLGTQHPWLVLGTNVVALVLHVAEGVLAHRLADHAYIFRDTCDRWFYQTLILGFPSLRLIVSYYLETKRTRPRYEYNDYKRGKRAD